MNNNFIYIIRKKLMLAEKVIFDIIILVGLNWQKLFGGCMYILKRFQVINGVSPAAPSG